MQIPRSMVDAMTEMVNATSLTAQANLRVMLETVDWTADVATVREQLIRIMHSVCGMATDEAARIATEMYDGIRTIEMGQPLGAEPTSGREPDATEGAVRAFVDKLVNDKPVDMLVRLLLARVDYETKVAASQAALECAKRDRVPPRFARVPSGAETCDFCLMLASRGFAYHTEAAASHAHSNCVVGDTKVSGTGLLASMRRKYEGPLVHIVTRTGRKLTVTPNHPILTARGWICASEVIESDNLVCTNLFDGHDFGVPDVGNEPPTIEQVFKASSFYDSSALNCMPATTKYLHREMFTDCDVKVVNPFGLLERAFESPSLKPFAHEGFTFAGGSGSVIGEVFDGDGTFDFLFNGSDSPLRGTMGRICLSCPLLWRHFGSSDDTGLGESAKFDTSFCKPSSDSWATDSESFGDGIDAFSVLESFNNANWHVEALSTRLDAIAFEYSIDGCISDIESISNLVGSLASLIEFDDVISLTVTEESCHVYNLSTAGGWYLSSGIITHNCDCRVIPSWKSRSVEGYDPAAIYDQWQASIDAKAKERAERNGTTEADERRGIMDGYRRSAALAHGRSPAPTCRPDPSKAKNFVPDDKASRQAAILSRKMWGEATDFNSAIASILKYDEAWDKNTHSVDADNRWASRINALMVEYGITLRDIAMYREAQYANAL